MPDALVTGTSSGLGAEIARNLLENHWRVTGVSRRAGKFSSPRFRDLRCDLTDIHQMRNMVSSIQPHSMDVLVCNAGIYARGRLDKCSDENIVDLMTINLISPILLVKLTLPKLRRPGRIIFVNSVSGTRIIPLEIVYGASKHGLAAFANGLGHELASEGISVSTIFPGGIDTPLRALHKLETTPDKLLNVAELASYIAWIASLPPTWHLKSTIIFPAGEWH